MNANLIDATNVDIYHQYIHTHLNTDADTVKRSIEKRHYLKNQCWRNALIDYYGDTIMSETKRNKNQGTMNIGIQNQYSNRHIFISQSFDIRGRLKMDVGPN